MRTPSGPREMKSRSPNPGSNPPAVQPSRRGLQRAGHSYPNRCLTPYVSSSDDDSEETLYSSSPEPKKIKLPHEMRKCKPIELPPPSPETERLWQEGVPFAKWAEYLNLRPAKNV
ncbi:hypothetical protein Moror_13744 [Moniliophthora roreri MCA 2997]|uniref:Uncharacterized protein n=1 Tax=Moniliophthora roreri (strain MCA 2997) TaxID=1381753 RepID=V2XCU4_MONRO|nr:hypothetical protein Moror_13744 [Moniliophthora roreri MCA 2997]